MKRHKRLWEQVASRVNLEQAAKEALRGKRSRRAGAQFFTEWEVEVARLHRELADGSYRPGPYHYFSRSVRAWVAHAAHAQSWGLRRHVLAA